MRSIIVPTGHPKVNSCTEKILPVSPPLGGICLYFSLSDHFKIPARMLIENFKNSPAYYEALAAIVNGCHIR